MEGRHQYNDYDKFLFSMAKEQLSYWVEKLKESGVRSANIEIELTQCIKEHLKE